MKPQLAAVFLVLISVMSGCALNPVRMQVPDFTGAHKFGVVIEFSNVLNLPAGSRIAYEGADVGVVRGVKLDHGVAQVSAELDGAAQIPGDSTAAIVQDTVLGDSYIRLARPAGDIAAPPLTAGAVVPIARTLPPTSIEDMMAILSSFLGTGSLQKLQSVLRRMNRAMPSDPTEAVQVAATLASDLRNLAAHTGEVDRTLAGLGDLAKVLQERSEYVDEDYLSDHGQLFWHVIPNATTSVLSMIGGVGSLIGQGYWLIPLFDSVATALEQTGVPSFQNFTNQALLPFALNPRVDITTVTSLDGTDRTSDTDRLLRQLGAVR